MRISPERNATPVRLKDEPGAQLNSTRLLRIISSACDPEDCGVVEIHVRQREPSSVEQIEEVDSQLQRGSLRQARLLQDVEILGVERMRAQLAISRCCAPEEPVRRSEEHTSELQSP